MADRAPLRALSATLLLCVAVLAAADPRCVTCHTRQSREFPLSPMGRSFGPVAPSEPGVPAAFRHQATSRNYRVFRHKGGLAVEESVSSIYTDLRQLAFAIGSGNHARSFLVERAGRLFEAPLTYFKTARRWDMSPGYDSAVHVGFTREVSGNCLYCHTAGKGVPQPIDCERCHGPGALHMATPGGPIVNPAKLAPRLREQVCEQCHLMGAARVLQPGRSPADYSPGEPLEAVLAIFAYDDPERGQARVTGHPEQLRDSNCWKAANDRLWCGTCHQVHRPPTAASRASYYRAKCLSCHSAGSCTAPQGARGDCARCHMPKIPVAESAHIAFTDHRIRRRPADQAPLRPARTETLIPLLRPSSDRTVATRNIGLAYLDLAGSTGRTEILQKAVEALEPLAGTAVADGRYWENLGEAYLQQRNLQAAENAFRKAVSANPRSASAQYGLGFTQQAANRLVQAIDAYRAAVAVDPQKAEAWANLASACLATGQDGEAERSLETAVRLEPGNLAWRSALKKLRPRH